MNGGGKWVELKVIVDICCVFRGKKIGVACVGGLKNGQLTIIPIWNSSPSHLYVVRRYLNADGTVTQTKSFTVIGFVKSIFTFIGDIMSLFFDSVFSTKVRGSEERGGEERSDC